jgi:hypothetical protein
LRGLIVIFAGGQTEHDFDQLLKDFVSQLGLKLNVDKLANVSFLIGILFFIKLFAYQESPHLIILRRY